MDEVSPCQQTEVSVDEHVNNTWYPQQFQQHKDLIEEFKKIESRHEPAVTPSIFRVPTHLKRSYFSACKPMYVSIGPYNRGESKLRFMEAYKLHYLYELGKRIKLERWQMNEFVDLLRTELKENESRARSCYSNLIKMKSDEFVEMMLLDSCFIVEFLFKLTVEVTPVIHETTPVIHETTPVISTSYGWTFVLRDLLLLENQLPFFVLEYIYRKVDNSDRPMDALIEKLHNLLLKHTPFKIYTSTIVPANPRPFQMPPEQTPDHLLQQTPDHLLHLFHLSLIGQDDHKHTQPRRNLFYRKATKLELSGVKFKTKDDGRLLHVSFHNGNLEMSPLTLNETSSIYLRNFVALEQCQEKYGLHFTSYMFFVDNLVDSNKDVELLINRGIFYNDMGSNEVVVKHFFDRFSNEIVTNSTCNHLYDTLQEMEKYCEKAWPKWKSTLSRDYFNNPWSIASFFAAVLLLALTMLQASGTIYRYIKNN